MVLLPSKVYQDGEVLHKDYCLTSFLTALSKT